MAMRMPCLCHIFEMTIEIEMDEGWMKDGDAEFEPSEMYLRTSQSDWWKTDKVEHRLCRNFSHLQLVAPQQGI
jgi:hypothetical protein